jgi:hypothetical protein
MAEKKRFLLRIDEDLWNDLQTWAADELRSVNGQIEYLLRQSISARRRGAAGTRKEVAPDRSKGT